MSPDRYGKIAAELGEGDLALVFSGEGMELVGAPEGDDLSFATPANLAVVVLIHIASRYFDLFEVARLRLIQEGVIVVAVPGDSANTH